MKITHKLKFNSLLVLVLLALNVVVAISLIRQIMRDVQKLTEVEQPLKQAVLEMEINASETSSALLDYIRDHEEHYIREGND